MGQIPGRRNAGGVAAGLGEDGFAGEQRHEPAP